MFCLFQVIQRGRDPPGAARPFDLLLQAFQRFPNIGLPGAGGAAAPPVALAGPPLPDIAGPPPPHMPQQINPHQAQQHHDA